MLLVVPGVATTVAGGGVTVVVAVVLDVVVEIVLVGLAGVAFTDFTWAACTIMVSAETFSTVAWPFPPSM